MTGAAGVTCSLLSTAEASIEIVDPGAALAGTVNAKLSLRVVRPVASGRVGRVDDAGAANDVGDLRQTEIIRRLHLHVDSLASAGGEDAGGLRDRHGRAADRQ